MAIKVRHAGALRTIQTMRVRVGGQLRRVRSVKVKDGSTLRTVANFAPPLSLSIVPNEAYGYASGKVAVLVESNWVTATPVGGVAPFTYSWSRVSLDSDVIISGATSASANFSKILRNQSETGLARCTATDSFGSTAQAVVNVTLVHQYFD